MNPGIVAEALRSMHEEEIRAFAKHLVRSIERASTREVYYFQSAEFVLKLAPLCVAGDDKVQARAYSFGQNLSEARLWENLPSDVRPHFAEVVAYDSQGLWLIQEKVVPLMDFEPLPDTLVTLARQLGVGDLKGTNVGWRGEVPVIFDYGISRLWERTTGLRHISLEQRWNVTRLPNA